MITKKSILSLVALAGFSASALAQLPPPNNGPGGQWPVPPAPPCCHSLQWQALCTSNKFPASPVAGIAASTDTGDFIAVASDNSGNDYSAYLLQGNNLTQGWTKLTTFSDFNFASIYYRNNTHNNSNGFRITGRDLNAQPQLMLSFDNGSNWQQAQFVGIGSDYFGVASDESHFQFTNNAGKIESCGIGSDSFTYSTLPFRSRRFTAVAQNSNDFVAVGSDGSTYVAPVPAPGPTAGPVAPAQQ